MTRGRPDTTPIRRAPVTEWPLRLDLLVNPYGPSIRVQEAIAAATDLHLPTFARETAVRQTLAAAINIPPERLVLTCGIDEAIAAIFNWHRDAGRVVMFPPSDISQEIAAHRLGIETQSVPRSFRFAVDVDPAATWDVPPSATALVMSPNDPTGTLLSPQDAVRLSRRCELVVVDERHVDYGGRSLVPLVREFDNLVVLQTFETWAGLTGFPFAYLIAPPTLAGQIARFRPRAELPAASLIAAEATLADLAYVRAAAHRVREEKARLYRTLRKLNMVRPIPSWANFLLARVERGDAILFERELAEHLRISAVGPESTLELKRALIEISATL